MENRLLAKIRKAKINHSKLFCAFLTLGYPSLKTTEHLILEFEKLGVDIVELGIPFSDPLADGPTIQFSSEAALKKGVRIKDAFNLVARLRRKGSQIPVIFFSYLNPVYYYGFKRFAKEAGLSGFDGVIIPDLPPEEEKELQRACRLHGLAQIFLVTPTTTKKRALFIARKSQGFIYYVSLRGVTGARKSLVHDLGRLLSGLRKAVHKPVLVGFGVSSPEQARLLSRSSDGVIVGSALIEELRRLGGKPEGALHLVRRMIRAVKAGR